MTISAKVNDKVVTRPYSIFSSPNAALTGKLEIGVQTAGYFSTWITSNAKVGDKVNVDINVSVENGQYMSADIIQICIYLLIRLMQKIS